MQDSSQTLIRILIHGVASPFGFIRCWCDDVLTQQTRSEIMRRSSSSSRCSLFFSSCLRRARSSHAAGSAAIPTPPSPRASAHSSPGPVPPRLEHRSNCTPPTRPTGPPSSPGYASARWRSVPVCSVLGGPDMPPQVCTYWLGSPCTSSSAVSLAGVK